VRSIDEEASVPSLSCIGVKSEKGGSIAGVIVDETGDVDIVKNSLFGVVEGWIIS
jgi:hypothetical protein